MALLEVSFRIKRHLDVDMEFLKPSKKLKLDLPNNHDANLENDDEWGDDDITAEEFDMLETQATQRITAGPSKTFQQPHPVANGKNKAIFIKEEEMKQQQYELDGKVRILSDSIAKLSKELSDEKINRDKLIAQKVSEFRAKENTWQKEIQKLESVLQFKNQEMKTVYDKVHTLEVQLKEKKEASEKKKENTMKEEKLTEKKSDPQSSKFQVNFIKRFQFEAGPSTQASDTHIINNKPFSRKYRLQIDTPEGKTRGTEIVSSILCNRLGILPAHNSFISPLITNQGSGASGKNSVQISPVSVARLNSDKETEELLNYFDNVLKNYVTHLNGISNWSTVAGPSTTSPLSLRRKESSQDSSYVISVLKDLSQFLSCHQFVSLLQKMESSNASSEENKKVSKQSDLTQAVNTPANICHKIAFLFLERIDSLFQSLVSLSNPNTYPTGSITIEEIEWSFTALVSWSASAPLNLMQYANKIPLASFINSYHSTTTLLLTLKLLTNICTCKGIIPVINHQNDVCILCSLATLTHKKICESPMEFVNIMPQVEDFFSSLFAVNSFSTLFYVYSSSQSKLEPACCPSLILQGIVCSLLKFFEIHREKKIEFNLIFRKGFTLLHLLSRYFPNCKRMRTGFEDSYILLVGGMLTMSKENPLYKDFHDLIHDMWDFQNDTSELDLDEPSEDFAANMDLSSQTSS